MKTFIFCMSGHKYFIYFSFINVSNCISTKNYLPFLRPSRSHLTRWCHKSGSCAGPMRGVQPVHGSGARSQEGARESLKDPIALATLFRFFWEYFQLKSSILREVSAYPRGSKTVLFCFAKFLLEALVMWQGGDKPSCI